MHRARHDVEASADDTTTAKMWGKLATLGANLYLGAIAAAQMHAVAAHPKSWAKKASACVL